MKLLFVHPIFSVFGGAEKVILDLCGMCKKDYEVQIYTLFKVKETNTINGVYGEFIEKPLLVSIFGYKINPFISGYIKKLGLLLAKNYKMGDKIILSNFPASLVLYEAIKNNQKIRKEDICWISFEPDRILYYNKTVNLGYMPPDLIKFRYRFITIFLKSWRKKDYFVIKNIGKITTLSDYVTELTKKVYRISGVETGLCMYINPKEIIKVDKKKAIVEINKHYNLNLSNGDLIILSLSRLEHSKGLLQLVNILEQLKNKDIKFKCLIGGTGTLYNQLEIKSKFVKEIKLLGFIPDYFLKQLYSVSDIFVFLGKKETGGPLTILEAMYCGSIPIAANDAGPVELINHQKSGFLVNPDDDKEIINLIYRLSVNKDNNKLEKIKTLAINSIVEKHTLDIFYEKFKNLLFN